MRLLKLSSQAKLRSNQNLLRRVTFDGWRISMIGVYRDSYGGVIKLQCTLLKFLVKSMTKATVICGSQVEHKKKQKEKLGLLYLARISRSRETKTSWIHGSPQVFGPLQPLDGRRKLMISKRFTQLPCL